MTTMGLNLPETMRAVVCHGPRDYRLESVPTPTAGPGEVVVRVLAAGICAGDAKCYAGAPLFWGDAHRRGTASLYHPGHEFVGEVVALGRGTTLRRGHRRPRPPEQIVPCWSAALSARPVLDV